VFDDKQHDESAESASALQEELETRIAELEQELAEAEDRYLRAAAELRNYRQRVVGQHAQQMQYAHEAVVTALVPVLDHLELALESARSEEQSPQEVVSGVEMTFRQLLSVLEQFGLTRLATVGEQFDPRLHEAIERRPVKDEQIGAGQIIEEFRPGYKLHDRVVRPAEVCVCVKSEASEDTGENQ